MGSSKKPSPSYTRQTSGIDAVDAKSTSTDASDADDLRHVVNSIESIVKGCLETTVQPIREQMKEVQRSLMTLTSRMEESTDHDDWNRKGRWNTLWQRRRSSRARSTRALTERIATSHQMDRRGQSMYSVSQSTERAPSMVISPPDDNRKSPYVVNSMSMPGPPVGTPATASARSSFQPVVQVQHDVLLHPDGAFCTAFEVVYLLLLMVETWLVTTCITKECYETFPEPWAVSLHTIATVYYIGHIALQCNMAVLDGWQLIDDNRRRIIGLYKRGWLRFDILVTIPFDLLALPFSPFAFRALQFIRTIRLARVLSLFRTSNPLRSKKRLGALIALCGVVLTHHVIAIIHLLVRGASAVHDEYSESLYWAVQTTTSVGYGDISYEGQHMRWLAIFVMLVGSGLYGWFLGNISVYFLSKDHVYQKQQEQKEMLLSLMTRYEVPPEIQKEAFCVYPLIFGEGGTHNYNEILELLPPFMQEKIGLQMRIKLLKQVPMFSCAESHILNAIADRLSRHYVDPNFMIIEVGERGKEMFFIGTGAVEVLIPNGDTLKQISILKDGNWFGEIAILKETRRTAAVRTITACDLYMLTKEDFMELRRAYPDTTFERNILAEVERRMEAFKLATPATSPPSASARHQESIWKSSDREDKMNSSSIPFDDISDTPEDGQEEDELPELLNHFTSLRQSPSPALPPMSPLSPVHSEQCGGARPSRALNALRLAVKAQQFMKVPGSPTRPISQAVSFHSDLHLPDPVNAALSPKVSKNDPNGF